MTLPREDKAPNAPRGHLVSTEWPACRYSPDGEAKIFQTADDVPDGWADHPSKHNPEAVQERRLRVASLEEREAEVVRQQMQLAHDVLALEEREKALDAREEELTAPKAEKGRLKKAAKFGGPVRIVADDVDDSADDADED